MEQQEKIIPYDAGPPPFDDEEESLIDGAVIRVVQCLSALALLGICLILYVVGRVIVERLQG